MTHGIGAATVREVHRRLRSVGTVRKTPETCTDSSHSELASMNAKLELAARQWRLTADAIDDALVLIDATDNILRMNRAAADSAGGSWSTWVGQPSAQLARYPPWAEALSLGRDARQRDTIVTGRAHNAESGRTWELWARPLPDPVDSAVLLIARDVTAFLELQDSVRRAETMAALGTLTVGFAHEVRNPLFAISSLVDAWAAKPGRDGAPFVDALRRQVVRLQTLMVEILEFGKPSGKIFEPRKLSTTVRDAIRACHPEASARRVSVIPSICTDGEVAMNPARLERVFVNLIQNAVQHSPEDAQVTVEVTSVPASPDPALQVIVRDRGPGISLDDLPRLFTPFFSRRIGGFGLGLAISERIVEDHHGRLTATNHPTGGAVMTVILPIAKRDPATAAAGKAEAC